MFFFHVGLQRHHTMDSLNFSLKIASAVDEGWYVESSNKDCMILHLHFHSCPYSMCQWLCSHKNLPIRITDIVVICSKAVHLDGKGFAVTFRNKYGDIQQVNVQGTTCSFER